MGVTVEYRELIADLTFRTPKGRKVRSIEVSYGGKDAPYAIYVHEDKMKFHPHGQAKFLEEPARRYADEIIDEVVRVIANKKGLDKALIAGANVLLNYSLPLVPVDTGALKNSQLLEWRD